MNDMLKGFIGLILFTTLFWSLNLNFNITEASWLEVFGLVAMIFMGISTLISIRKSE